MSVCVCVRVCVIVTVLEAADCLVAELLSLRAQHECLGNSVCEGVCKCVCLDPAAAVLRAVTNVVCRLVFSGNYSSGDPELREVMDYNDGIVQTIARGDLVDIYPWLRVGFHSYYGSSFLTVNKTIGSYGEQMQ